MSNQIGDRYTCSDPNCGCEIQINSPCRMFDGRSATTTHVEEASNPGSARPTSTHTSEVGPVAGNISNLGDSGSPTSTGEGVFGTSGGGSESATRQGRYGSDVRKAASSPVTPMRTSGSAANRVANSSLDPADDLSVSDDMDSADMETVDDLDTSTASRSISMSLTCFCGNPMTQAESRSSAARAARMG
jgi:hypothetical protein